MTYVTITHVPLYYCLLNTRAPLVSALCSAAAVGIVFPKFSLPLFLSLFFVVPALRLLLMASQQTDISEGALFSLEKFWRDRYEWLQHSGYSLRPRYKPNWIPSWRGTDKSYYECEDGVVLWVSLIHVYRDSHPTPTSSSRPV